MTASAPARCQRCGDIIGVYEPMICLDEAGPRRTSALVEHERPEPAGTCFHDSCYAGLPDAGATMSDGRSTE